MYASIYNIEKIMKNFYKQKKSISNTKNLILSTRQHKLNWIFIFFIFYHYHKKVYIEYKCTCNNQGMKIFERITKLYYIYIYHHPPPFHHYPYYCAFTKYNIYMLYTNKVTATTYIVKIFVRGNNLN